MSRHFNISVRVHVRVSTYIILKEEDSTEKAEKVSGEQGEVDGGGAAQFHHDGHTAVQAIHAQCEGREQQA